ncbi:hypothetical protein GIB67_002691 [Kingdonia uniflora]|uniref:Cullin N-terminal domain-containing protein n=1 Tax=Kingdonia uniflora TaxID=39325 RepID=A0A7J7LJL7_9MAGN|nr:hypothetical protein GIB67_002691 [Kingdonia uniflora]
MGGNLYQRIENECEAHILKAVESLVGQSPDLVVFLSLVEKCWQDLCDQMLMIRGVKYMQQSDVPEYLKHVELRLHGENERCFLYLDESTRKPLVATAERQLLERHTSAILDKGFTMLMDGNRIEDLRRMYVLFSRVNAFESLRQALSSYIRGTGQGMVMDEEKDKDLVSSILVFKASLDTIWEESFSRNEVFSITIKDAFEHLINLRQARAQSYQIVRWGLEVDVESEDKFANSRDEEGFLDDQRGHGSQQRQWASGNGSTTENKYWDDSNQRGHVNRYGFHDRRGQSRKVLPSNFGSRSRNDGFQACPGIGSTRYGQQPQRGQSRKVLPSNFGSRSRNDGFQACSGIGSTRYGQQPQYGTQGYKYQGNQENQVANAIILAFQNLNSDAKINLSNFDGKSDVDSFIDWLNRVDKMLAFKKCIGQRAVSLVETQLIGYALNWWESVQQLLVSGGDNYVTDWEVMRGEVMTRFIPSTYEEESFAKLQTLRHARNRG